MGGTASLVVASSEGDRIEAVVTLSAPESIEGLVAGPDVVQQVTAAKLFLAGNADDASAQAATDFYDESLQPKRVEILTTADHGTDILNGNQGEISAKLIDDWLVRYLPGSTGTKPPRSWREPRGEWPPPGCRRPPRRRPGRPRLQLIRDAETSPERARWPATGGLLAQLHPLVPRALQELLVLLLPHLLAALLDQRRQAALTLDRLIRFRTGAGGRHA